MSSRENLQCEDVTSARRWQAIGGRRACGRAKRLSERCCQLRFAAAAGDGDLPAVAPSTRATWAKRSMGRRREGNWAPAWTSTRRCASSPHASMSRRQSGRSSVLRCSTFMRSISLAHLTRRARCTRRARAAPHMQRHGTLARRRRDAHRWAPLDRERHRVLADYPPCRPCSFRECPYGHPCTHAIDAQQVLVCDAVRVRPGGRCQGLRHPGTVKRWDGGGGNRGSQSSKVVSDETRLISVELHTRTVGVTRVSVNRPVDAECGPRQEGDSLIVPIFEYVPIVTTQLTLKEEVRITTHTLEKEDLWQVPVKLETIVVERRHARCRGSFLSVRSIPCRQPPVPPHERCCYHGLLGRLPNFNETV